VLLALLSPLMAAEHTLWTIGVEDGSSREFGRTVRWSDPKDEVVFRVGQSQPAKDWPAMHPGPSNAAANGQTRSSASSRGLAARAWVVSLTAIVSPPCHLSSVFCRTLSVFFAADCLLSLHEDAKAQRSLVVFFFVPLCSL
jgi:hypothetical protein